MLAIILHLVLALTAPVNFYIYGDSDTYARLAINLALRGSYGIQNADTWLQTVRTPGYPAFIALLVRIFNATDLNLIVAAQAVLSVLAISSLALSLRRWVPKRWLMIVILLGSISPVAVLMTRAILSDGLAAQCVMFALAAYVEFYATKSRLMLAVFSLAAACAALTRPPAGIVMLLPVFGMIEALIWARSIRNLLMLAATFFPIGASMLGWATFNQIKFNYFAVSSYEQAVRFAGRMDTGTFDARVLNPDLYRQYILGREAANYSQYHVYFIGPIATWSVTDPQRYPEQLNLGWATVIDASDRLNSIQLVTARYLRGIWWGLVFPDEYNFNGVYLPYKGDPRGDDTLRVQIEFQNKMSNSIPEFVYPPKATHWPFSIYVHRGYDLYDKIRPGLIVLAAISAIIALQVGGWIFAAPFTIYLGNLLVHVYLAVIYNRYVESLDYFLLVQIVVALALAANSGFQQLRERDGVYRRRENGSGASDYDAP